MTWIALAAMGVALALPPFAIALRNLGLHRPPGRPREGAAPPRVSVLIPARDEEAAIDGAVRSALACEGVDLEVLVLDDRSEDRTAAIAGEIVRQDGRVRLLRGRPLPAGWCGKPWACQALAAEARGDVLVFIDADVRLSPDSLARMAAFLAETGSDYASGVPRQETGSFLERLLIPLIHFVLLGFLPFGGMRRSRKVSFAAGCGQLVAVRREAYRRAGGHGAVRRTLHDGLMLPRAFRRAGLRTDLFDATAIATCRMYRGARATWRGLAKNAVEGLGAPRVIGPMTILLSGGQVLPFALLAVAPLLPPAALALASAGAAMAWIPRLLEAARYRLSWLGAWLHPLGVAVLLANQWWALARHLAGKPSSWRGREYTPSLSRMGGAS